MDRIADHKYRGRPRNVLGEAYPHVLIAVLDDGHATNKPRFQLNAPCSACIVPRVFRNCRRTLIQTSELSFGRPCILGSWRNLAYSQAMVRSSFPLDACCVLGILRCVRVSHQHPIPRSLRSLRHQLFASPCTVVKSAQAIYISLPKLVQSRLFPRDPSDRLARTFAILVINLYSTVAKNG